MKAEAFEELLTSVRQLGEIRRGERKPSRSRTFKPTDVKAVRADLGQSQSEFALMIGVSVESTWWPRSEIGNRGAGCQTVPRSRCCKWPPTIRRRSSKHCIVRAVAAPHNDACCSRATR